MSYPAWQLRDGTAAIELPSGTARLSLDQPGRGIHWSNAAPRAGILALVPAQAEDGLTLTECFVREREIVAAYRRRSDPTATIDAVWRAETLASAEASPGRITPPSTAAAPVALELLVSVHTQQLESWPELWVESRWPTTSAFHLHVGNVAADASFDPTPGSPAHDYSPAEGAGCWLLGEPQSEADAARNYLEMVYPADFERSTVGSISGPTATGSAWTQLQHRLFARPLEKGVILRAWIRGVLLSPATAPATAAALYRDFAARQPRLSTS